VLLVRHVLDDFHAEHEVERGIVKWQLLGEVAENAS